MLQKKLVLGSSSPYRKELLERLGVPFECVSADIDESRHEGETPEALCVRLAREKALKVKSMVGDAIVIGSDQVAVLGEFWANPTLANERLNSFPACKDKRFIF